jgi:hypothetical protein
MSKKIICLSACLPKIAFQKKRYARISVFSFYSQVFIFFGVSRFLGTGYELASRRLASPVDNALPSSETPEAILNHVFLLIDL